MKPKIFVTGLLPEAGLGLLRDFFEVSQNTEDRLLTKQEILTGIQNKEALLCFLTDTIDKEIIEKSPDLKIISNYAVGFNNIDIETANKRKIPVCITPGILTNTTADLTWALILTAARRIVEADKYTREGLFTGWAPNLFLGMDIFGKTLGIVGMGRIGQAVSKRAEGFGMRVIYHSRSKLDIPGEVSLDTLLETADIISLHTPLTDQTRHLIGKKELAKMKKTAILINTTRGAVVDEKALLEALKSHQIFAAGLDVYEEEPKITEGLLQLPNVVLLPHIGSASFETRNKMAEIAALNAISIFKGEEPRMVANPEVLG